MTKFIIVCFLLVFSTLDSVVSQVYSEAKIFVMSGTYPQFYFNTWDKFNNGIVNSNYTRFNVHYKGYSNDQLVQPPTPDLEGWKVAVRAKFPVFTGDNSNLLADRVIVKVESVTDCSIRNSEIELSNAWQTIVFGVNFIPANFTISFLVGTDPTKRVLGSPTDFYSNELEFQLLEDDGF